MLYDPRWDKRDEEPVPGIPVRNPLFFLMLTLPWIMLFGMVGIAMNGVAELTHVQIKHVGR